jgi:hypothetical protein
VRARPIRPEISNLSVAEWNNLGYGNNSIQRVTDLRRLRPRGLGALCVALYQAWIQPIQGIVALVILVVAAVGLTVFG